MVGGNDSTEHSNYDRTLPLGKFSMAELFWRKGSAILLFFNSAAVDRCSTCSVALTNSLQERRIVDGTERGGVRRRLGLAPSGAAAPARSASLDAK